MLSETVYLPVISFVSLYLLAPKIKQDVDSRISWWAMNRSEESSM